MDSQQSFIPGFRTVTIEQRSPDSINFAAFFIPFFFCAGRNPLGEPVFWPNLKLIQARI
jgi:hypothetical protein